MDPLVSVITPTWQRHDLLIGRCIPSVQAQTYTRLEHLVISDGPDPELALRIGQEAAIANFPILFLQLDENPDHRWGVRPRLAGLEAANGDFIAYLDDDDAYRQDHCQLLVDALKAHPEAGFAYSQMASHSGLPEGFTGIVGTDVVGPCAIGTPMIMHRRELLELATWGPPDPMEDWRLVDRWMERGVKAQFVPVVTVDVWPSSYWPVG